MVDSTMLPFSTQTFLIKEIFYTAYFFKLDPHIFYSFVLFYVTEWNRENLFKTHINEWNFSYFLNFVNQDNIFNPNPSDLRENTTENYQ